MPYNLERLESGDITTDGGHTMMYVGRVPDDGSRWGGFAFVDVYPISGVKMQSSQYHPLWFDNAVYRCADPELAAFACAYAKIWAAKQGTAYSPQRDESSPRYVKGSVPDKRSQGVEEEKRRFEAEEQVAEGSGRAPPFEFDALLRSLKWAARLDHPFSANRGSTCCAFVIACYHAASIWKCAKGELGPIEAAIEDLKQRRLKKAPVTAQDLIVTGKSHKVLSPASFRRFSNPGGVLGQGETFAEFADRTLSTLNGASATLKGVFTEPLLVDAKYTHTKLLIAQFRRVGAGWAKQNFELGNPMV